MDASARHGRVAFEPARRAARNTYGRLRAAARVVGQDVFGGHEEISLEGDTLPVHGRRIGARIEQVEARYWPALICPAHVQRLFPNWSAGTRDWLRAESPGWEVRKVAGGRIPDRRARKATLPSV